MSEVIRIRWNARAIQALKPREKRFIAWDISRTGRGVRVAPTGRKSFILEYRFEGRPRMMTVGPYGKGPGKLTLAAANTAYAEAEGMLENGEDPGSALVDKRREEREAETVRELVDQYIERYAKAKKKSWREDLRLLEKDVIPAWGKKKVATIQRKQVIHLLDRIVDRGSPIAANRTFAALRRMLAWAVERSIIDVSPCTGIKSPGKEQRRDRVLDEEEIRRFWYGLDEAKMSQAVRLALRFMLISGQRKSEVLTAEWAEIRDGWWVIPAEKSKNGLAHRVWLSPLARETLEEARSLADDSRWIFPSPAKTDARITTGAINYALRANNGLGIDPHWTPHDLRRSAATRMSSAGVSRIELKKVLNHSDPDITAIYDGSSYDPEKKRALNHWSRELKRILGGTASEKVVRLTSA